MAAEPKDDGDRLEHIRKVVDHLGNSNLEEKLNDFLELHAEELRSELRDSERRKGEYSLRIHQIYMGFLEIVQANLEEFLQREGLTEDELRAALQGEILDGEAGGVNFMNALVSSWEFSRPVCQPHATQRATATMCDQKMCCSFACLSSMLQYLSFEISPSFDTVTTTPPLLE